MYTSGNTRVAVFKLIFTTFNSVLKSIYTNLMELLLTISLMVFKKYDFYTFGTVFFLLAIVKASFRHDS